MLPKQSMEELLSISYVSAVIAVSGFAPNEIDRDYGTDLEVRHIAIDGEKRIDLGAFLSLQLKATINWQKTDTEVSFDLEADAYNRLIYQSDNSSIPTALVVCCLPKDLADWLDVCEDDLRIRKCCYYHFLEGPKTTNSGTKRVHIPRSQLLTPEALKNLKQSLFGGVLS
jgi:hypothetical protein